MPRASHVKIPEKCLKSKFSKEEQLLVVRSMLMQINLKVLKSQTLYLRIPGFGDIFTHGNKKSSKAKYQKKYNKKIWKEKKKENQYCEKLLLY